MITKEKFEELEKKQNELRKQRNKLADQQQEIQKQINEIEIQKYDADQYIGKIIVVDHKFGLMFKQTLYMIVDRVERLFKGPRFYGRTFDICYSRSSKIGNSIEMCERDETSAIKWEDVENIKVVTSEFLKDEINKFLSLFDYGEEMNKLKK